jgi:hypothetical protein
MTTSGNPVDKEAYEKLKKKMADSAPGQFFTDIGKSWKAILILVFTGTLLSFFFIWLMSYYARCMAIVSISLLLLAFIGGGGLCIFAGTQATDGGGAIVLGLILLILGAIFAC